jgi:peptidoglycan/xylan/chitin deacetylase (PgdA/CDA1 family)
MSIRLKSKLVNSACELGGFQLARLLTAQRPRVLMYHRFSAADASNKVSAAVLDQQMAELKNNFNVQPLSHLTDCIRNRESIPRNSIVITVDDGYEDFHRVAFPVFKKYGIAATVYITSDFIDGKLWLWPDKIASILANTRSDSLTATFQPGASGTLPLVTPTEQAAAWSLLINHCLGLGEDARRVFIDMLAQNLGVKLAPLPDPEYAPMSWSAVREISGNGIEIGAHSRTHPVLSCLNQEQLQDEIHGSKQKIEAMISRPVSAFCYPNGQPDDYNELVKKVVIDSNFTSATVAFHDKVAWNDLFEIRRYAVGQDMVQFRKALYGVEYLSDLLQ